jgi:hypothetical protein
MQTSKKNKEPLKSHHNVNAQLKEESVVFIQRGTLNESLIHANIELDKLTLRRY